MGRHRKSSGTRIGYRLLFVLLSPALLAYTAWIAFKGGGRRYLVQRLGFYWDGCASNALWVHAASVGEVAAALPLIEELRRAHGERPVLVTTATPTGARMALERTPEGVEHAYLPIDSTGAVRRFLRRYRPRCALIMETELWPNLYAACYRQGVPLVIVNGRLSPRTLEAPRWLKGLYANALRSVESVLARSEEDADNFIRLGADPDRVRVIGNIKFADTAETGEIAPVQLSRPYVLAASTRDGEEKEVLGAWRETRSGGRLLVVAPRHPKRLEEILTDLEPFDARVAVRSRGNKITEQTEVYLADTLGELQRFIAGTDIVFVGGSLVPRGGHNLLEPARAGKTVLFGPHMENFEAEARLLLGENAAIRVGSPSELAETLSRLLADPQKAACMGQNAARAVAARMDMAVRYREAVERFCGGPS